MGTTAADPVFVDTNILVYATMSGSPFHARTLLALDEFEKIVGMIPTGGKQIHDANIVATMLAHGIPRLLTHNVGDFRRFSTLIEILPLLEAKKNGA
jgi:predicted nucleic acid-binding protein